MYHCIFYFSLFCYCKDAKQEEEEKIIVVNWYGPALDLFCDVLTKGTHIQDWHFLNFIQMLNMEDLIAEWKEAKSKMEQEQKKISEEDKSHIPEDNCQDKKQHKREPTKMIAQQSKQDCCVQGKDAVGKE